MNATSRLTPLTAKRAASFQGLAPPPPLPVRTPCVRGTEPRTCLSLGRGPFSSPGAQLGGSSIQRLELRRANAAEPGHFPPSAIPTVR